MTPQGCIPDGFTDFWEVAQVMILLHQCLVVRLLAWFNGLDCYFPEVQNGLLWYGKKKTMREEG